MLRHDILKQKRIATEQKFFTGPGDSHLIISVCHLWKKNSSFPIGVSFFTLVYSNVYFWHMYRVQYQILATARHLPQYLIYYTCI